MKNFKAITILLISIFAVGIIFTACEKGDETDDYTLPSVTDQVLQVATGEIAVTKTIDDFTEGSYDATIDDKQTIASFSNGNLYFLIPEMESGDYILNIDYLSDIVSLNLKVTKSVNIENPTEYLSNVDIDLKIYFTNNIQNIESDLEAGFIEEDLANEQIAYWNTQENRFAEELAKLSNDEKQDFANFLESNNVWIDELRNYMLESTKYNKDNPICQEYKTQALLAKKEHRDFAYIWFGLRYKQCKADHAPNPPASLGQIEYTFSYNPNWMISIWDTYVEPIFENIEQQLNGLNSNMVAVSIEDDKNKSVSTFANNTPQVLAYHIKFRSVNEADANGPFAHVVGVLNGFISFIDSLSDEISNFIGIDISFSNTSITQSFNRGMTIKNISNANVSLLSSEIVDDQWEVAFKSTGVGEQEFTFDVWYNDEKVEFSQRYDAILTVLEPYSIEILSGNNQSGELGELLEEPIEVLVKDEEGNPFENALVTFEVSEGSVSFDQTTTNEDGIAFTYWSLGTNNDEQELIAKAYESDGVTAVQGSPLAFSATEELVYITLVDIDGNVYDAVKIGDYYWMTENLVVTHYNDGVGIHEVDSDLNKAGDSYTYYNYDNTNTIRYGLMYDYSSVSKEDGQGLCPDGWHIPNSSEWNNLFLAVETIGELKGVAFCESPNIGASANSLLNILPGGYVVPELPSTATSVNHFRGVREEAVFWVYDSYTTWNMPTREFSYNSSSYISGSLHRFGYASCRCIKNADKK